MPESERNDERVGEPAQPTADSDGAAGADDETARLRDELQAARENLLRAHAEMDNSRKRMQREIDEERLYAAAPLLRDLLPVWDNLRRAIDAAEKAAGDKQGEAAGLLAGVKMVAQQLAAALEKHHCTEIPTVGEAFDPSLHEAILMQPSAQWPANTIVTAVQAGFQLRNRVLRPAQVIVSSGPPAGAAQRSSEGASAEQR